MARRKKAGICVVVVPQNGKKAFELIHNHPKNRFAAGAGNDGTFTTEG
jgi:hypothetical protein